MNFTFNKRELRDVIKLRYGWEFNDIPTVCVCGDLFDADHALICMRGGYIIQRHNEIRDLEAEILQAVCTDVEVEPVLQEVTGKCWRRAPTRPLTRGWISVRGASGRENSLRSLMLGFVTLTQTHTRTSPRSRFTSFMRMIKSVFTHLEFLR